MSKEEFALTETIRSLLLKEHATSDLTAAYLRGDFNDTLAELEKSFSEAPKDLEKKLWWMLFQLEAEKVPVTALSASVDEIYEEAKSQPQLSGLLGAVLLRAAARLTTREQMRLAISMIDHFIEVCGAHATVTIFLLEVCRREQKRIQALPAMNQAREKQFLAQIEERIKKLEKDSASTKPAVAAPVVPSIVPQALTENVEHIIPQPKPVSPILKIVAGAAVVIALGFVAARYLHSPTAEQAQPSLALIGTQPSPLLPELARKTMATLPSSNSPSGLDSVTERLQGLANQPKTPPQAQPAPLPPVEVTTNQNSPSLDSPQDRAKLPSMDPNRLSQDTPQSLDGGAPAGAAVANQGIVKGPDGRVFGPSPEQRAGSLSGARGLDGQPVQPVQVEELSQPKMYRMTVRGKVFSAPSVVAQIVSQLDAGSKIEVVARFGRWLEIRSLRGNRGYIYAQDAAPLNQ